MAKGKLSKNEKHDLDIIIKHTRNMFEELYGIDVADAPLSYTVFGMEIIHAVTKFVYEINKEQQ